MRDIIQNWLNECIGVRLNKENIGKSLSDGVIFAKLLKYYNIVTNLAVKAILPSDNHIVCENNLHQLCVWFRLLGIHITHDDVASVSKGKTTACLSLLYQLFVALHDDNVQFINTYDVQQTKHQPSKKHPCKMMRQQHHDLLHASEELIHSSCRSSQTHEYNKNVEENEERGEEEHKPLITTCTFTKITRDKSTEPTITKENTKSDKMRREDIWFVRNQLKTTPHSVHKNKRLSSECKALLERAQTINEEQRDHKQELELLEAEDFILKYNTEPSDPNNVEVVEESEKHEFIKHITENLLRQSDYEKQLAINSFQVTFQNEIGHNKFAELNIKQNENPKYETFFSTCKTSEEEIASQLKAIEKIELHRKLYDEKIRRRNKRRLIICQQIVSDLIEFAIKVSEYGKEDVTVELILKWKQMQETGEPLLQLISISEKDIPILQANELVISSNDRDFDDYNHLVGDWFEASGLDVSYDEHLTLSHILYRLYECRLPKPVPIEPAAIPRYMITGVVNCSFDELTTLKLATLLTKSNICIVDTKSAIQFCIDRYKIEADIKPPETKNKKPPPKSKDGTSKTGKRTISKKDNSKGKGKMPAITFKDEEVQTSESLLDNREVKLGAISNAAQLGMRMYNSNLSENIPTSVIVEVLVEFLKCQKDIKGWVLINFPSSLEEAYELEKVLSGKSFPKEFCQYDKQMEFTSKQNENKVKHSRLVQIPARKEIAFQTYFTSYINVISKDPKAVTKKEESDENAEDIEYEDIEEETVFEEIDLESIYKRQGILLNFFYEHMDFIVLQDLARAILQVENQLIRIPSNELFGEEVMAYYKPTVTDKPSTAKSSKPTSKKAPKSKDELTLAKEFFEKLLLAVKPTENHKSETAPQEILSKCEQSDEKEEIVPGQGEWPLAELPINEKTAIALSNSWEYLENIYIKTVKKLLGEFKKHEALVNYYENFVTKSLNQDNFQSKCLEVEIIVKTFIHHFNNILGNHRLHKKELEKLTNDILNFEMQLWRISNLRRNEAETRRQDVINYNWTANEMIDISKEYLSLIETEVTRTNSTIELLCKYYRSMGIALVANQDVPQVEIINYNTFCCDKNNIKSTISKMLTDKNEINQINPVCTFLKNIVSKYISEIGKIQTQFNYLNELKKTQTLNMMENLRRETNVVGQMSGGIEERTILEKISGEGVEEILEEEERDNINTALSALFEANSSDIKKMFHEWKYAIKCELDRLTWRIKIIIIKAIKTLDNVEKRMIHVFHKLLTDSISAYLNENKGIDELCRFLQTALNAKTQVKDDLINVVNNCVYIDEIKQTSIDEQLKDCCFTIQQLQTILEKLKCLCSNGIINSRALQFVVEDMIAQDEQFDDNLFPLLWRNLKANEFRHIWKTVFGDTNKLYWKYFLLYCLDIGFPEMEDIISFKQQFMSFDKDKNGTISYNDFMNIILWFQQNSSNNTQDIYYHNLKEFLFSMFKVNDNVMDYNDFFLSFSKGTTSSIGFSKALAYLSGKCIIISEQSEHLQSVLVEYNDLLSKMVREILEEKIITTLNDLYGVKIEELVDVHQNGKKVNRSTTISQLEKIKNREETKQTKLGTRQELHFTEIEEELEETEPVVKSIIDKESQTISLNELMYDMYINKHKLYQWTTKVHVDTINYLLETLVYPTLEFSSDEIISAKLIKKNITDMLSTLQEDGIVSVISLMKESALQNLFLSTHMFEIFSFPSLLKKSKSELFLLGLQ